MRQHILPRFRRLCAATLTEDTAGHDDTVAQHRDEGQRHDHRLDEIGGGDGAEAAEDGIAHDDEGRHQHCCHVIYAEEAVEQLAAGRKARGRIRHEEDDDDDCAQSVQQVALVMEAKRQELRYRDGVEVGRIAAEPPGHDEPVEPVPFSPLFQMIFSVSLPVFPLPFDLM